MFLGSGNWKIGRLKQIIWLTKNISAAGQLWKSNCPAFFGKRYIQIPGFLYSAIQIVCSYRLKVNSYVHYRDHCNIYKQEAVQLTVFPKLNQ